MSMSLSRASVVLMLVELCVVVAVSGLRLIVVVPIMLTPPPLPLRLQPLLGATVAAAAVPASPTTAGFLCPRRHIAPLRQGVPRAVRAGDLVRRLLGPFVASHRAAASVVER
jgi:hypothetical protein